MKEIHIGNLIKKKMEERNITVVQLAEAINCDRSNIYSIFSRKSMDIELLIAVSKALNFDFIGKYYLEKNEEKTTIITITICKKGNEITVLECKEV